MDTPILPACAPQATPASGSGERSSSDELSSSESHLTPFGALAQDRTETESPTSTLTAAPSQGFTSSMWGNPMGFGAFNPMMMAMHPMHAMQQMQWMWEQQQRMQQAWAMGGPGMGMVPNCMQPQTPLPPASNEQPSAAKAAAASQAQADKAGKQQAQAAGAGQSSKRRQAAQQQKKQQQQSEQAEQQQADRHDKAAAEAAGQWHAGLRGSLPVGVDPGPLDADVLAGRGGSGQYICTPTCVRGTPNR